MNAFLEGLVAGVELLAPYFSFVGCALIFAYLGQVFKKRIWTEELASKKTPLGRLAYVGRLTFPLHPVLLGWCVGYIPDLLVPIWVAGIGLNVYFALSGILSVYLYSAVRNFVKKRYGFELKLP